MVEIYQFVQKVRKEGRITIPETIRALSTIEDKDILYFAVSIKPFDVKTKETD